MSRQFINPFNSSRQVSNPGPGAPRTTAFSEHRFHSGSVNTPPGHFMPQPQPGYSDVINAINALSANLSKLVAGQDETDRNIQKVANAIETSHALLSKNIATRFKKLTDRVGKQEESISASGDKLREIDFNLQELLERTKDPLADAAACPQRDMAVATEEQPVGVACRQHVNTYTSQTRHSSDFVASPSTRLVHAAQWDTMGVNPQSSSPSSTAMTSPALAASLLKLPTLPSPTRPSAVSARNLEDGTVASLRKAALGDHMFVRPLEDTGLTRLDPVAVPSFDKLYLPSDPSAFPSPSVTPSLGDSPAQLPESAMKSRSRSLSEKQDDGNTPSVAQSAKYGMASSTNTSSAAQSTPAYRDSLLNGRDLSVTGWMSPLSSVASSPVSTSANLELAMKKELDTGSISRILARPNTFREESLSSLSSLAASFEGNNDNGNDQGSSRVRRTKRKSNPAPVFSSKKFKTESGRGASILKTTSQTRKMSPLASSCIWPKVSSGNMHREPTKASGRDCYRPGCKKRKLKDEFFVERLIGRRLIRGRPLNGHNEYQWLVQWHGYPISQATWQLEKTINDVNALISRFQEDAMEEGLPTDTNEEILLSAAAYNQPQGGWLG
ncbi:hypothetical protein HWV62_21822 [Athelia sp. TMB]|nr:hypothetical protein HWV62_21822 [Athelia sp. TMB]